MRVKDAIFVVDMLKPNQYDYKTKVAWLSKLDGIIWREVFMTHKGTCGRDDDFKGYMDADPDTELLVPYPYDEDVYNYYLQSQIDKENGETAKYNVSASLYNNAYKTFYDYYNRTHQPVPDKAQFIF